MTVQELKSMNFRERALWEAKHHKSGSIKVTKNRNLHKKKKQFWVLVKLSDGSMKWYQLPKKLQKAMKQYIEIHPENWQDFLEGALIDLPSKNSNGSKNSMITGKIVRIKKRKQCAASSSEVTQNRFMKPEYSKLGVAKYKQMYEYLKHGHGPSNRKYVKQNIHKLVPPVNNAAFNFMEWLLIG